MPHLFYILFLFALGACVGSFLNVVVWRLPQIEHDPKDSLFRRLSRSIAGLSNPPSHCPKCDKPLAWYDNIPVIGWIKLGGRCRYCKEPISPRYPIIEAITGGLFVFYYVMFFILQIGPCAEGRVAVGGEVLMRQMRPILSIADHWPLYALYMFLISALLAASLIDAELFIIPAEELCWPLAVMGLVVHAIIDVPGYPGALNANPQSAALAVGGGVGLLISIALWHFDRLPQSFPNGEPLLEVDRTELVREIEQAKREGREHPEAHLVPPAYTRGQIRAEIGKEMAFLLPPMLLAIVWWLLTTTWAPAQRWWTVATSYHWFTGFAGSLLGALVGGFVVWITRILGTIGFGRIAMGQGDVHLMFGVGAIVGAGAATVAFFIAPFFGLAIALYMLVTGTRRELPYGPYLSLATAFCLLFYCDIAAYLTPGMQGLVIVIRGLMGEGT
ncbi:MAG: prepilin peptidase [Tepidisphaeraceae bacterium]